MPIDRHGQGARSVSLRCSNTRGSLSSRSQALAALATADERPEDILNSGKPYKFTFCCQAPKPAGKRGRGSTTHDQFAFDLCQKSFGSSMPARLLNWNSAIAQLAQATRRRLQVANLSRPLGYPGRDAGRGLVSVSGDSRTLSVLSSPRSSGAVSFSCIGNENSAKPSRARSSLRFRRMTSRLSLLVPGSCCPGPPSANAWNRPTFLCCWTAPSEV